MFHVGIFPHFGALKIKVIFLNVRYLSHQMSEFGSFFLTTVFLMGHANIALSVCSECSEKSLSIFRHPTDGKMSRSLRKSNDLNTNNELTSVIVSIFWLGNWPRVHPESCRGTEVYYD